MNHSDTALWGTPIRFKEYHVHDDELERMRYEVDTLADNCLLALHENGITVESFITKLKDTDPSSYIDDRLRVFSVSVLSQPPWLDWELLRYGQYVFLKHYGSAALGLLYVSLIGGFAAPKITKVLDATAYMTKYKDATWRRMNETFEMVIDCIDSDDSLDIGQRGFNSVLKVRFLHSRVRLNLLGKIKSPWAHTSKSLTAKITEVGTAGVHHVHDGVPGFCPYNMQSFHASSRSCDSVDNDRSPDLIKTCATPVSITSIANESHDSTDSESNSEISSEETKAHKPLWDSAEFGLPINQEDMMATLLSFSVNVLDTIEKTTVVGTLTRADEDAYIHLWRYIGYLIGLHEDLNPCTSKERACGLMESAVLHLLKPDERSGELARHLLHSIADRAPLHWSYEMHSETARALLGDQLADALGIERNFRRKLYARFVLGLTTTLSFCFLPLLYRGSRRIEKVKRVLRYQVNRILYPPTTIKQSVKPKILTNTRLLICASISFVLFVKFAY